MEFLPCVLGAAFLAFLAFQAGIALRMRRLQGRPVPALGGDLGQRLHRPHPVLLYFYSPECPRCAVMTPMVQQLAAENVDIALVDITRTPEVAQSFGVLVTPATLMVKGGRIGRVLIGIQSERTLRDCAGVAPEQPGS
jgi:thioredoxin